MYTGPTKCSKSLWFSTVHNCYCLIEDTCVYIILCTCIIMNEYIIIATSFVAELVCKYMSMVSAIYS